MIAYTTVGSNDIERADSFYTKFFEPMKAGKVFDIERFRSWGQGPDRAMFAVCIPFDGEQATPGNGIMVTLACRDSEQVESQHALALELGGTDEGAPGVRGGRFFMAYFRDLDGNKIALFAPASVEAAT